MTRRLRLSLAILGLGAVVAAGCGKKAPPLAPLIIRPAAPEDVQVVRVADTVHVSFKVPQRNSDGKSPAALSAVDVYGLTGEARDADGNGLNAAALLRAATKVGSVDVEPPPPPASEDEDKAPAADPAAPPPPPPPPKPDDPRPAQGEFASVTEVVTPAVLTSYVPTGKPRRKPVVKVPQPWDDLPLPLAPVADEPLGRTYVVVGRDLKGRPGALSARVSVPLEPTPPTAAAPTLRYTENAIVVEWVVPPEARRPVFEAVKQPPLAAGGSPAAAPAAPVASDTAAGATVPPPAPPAAAAGPPAPPGAPPADAAQAPAGAPALPIQTIEVMPRVLFPGPTPHTFNLYVVPAPGTGVAPTGPEVATSPAGGPLVPVNPAPLSETRFEDPAMAFGVERCYVLRLVEARPNGRVEGPSSAVACITPTDTFPPRAPRNLAAVGSEGAINLIWEPNTEGDLGGYIVLRGLAGGGALTAVTEAPVKETIYRDTNVTRGQRYVYAVVAVDTATPQNVSVESNRVEETAR